MAINIAVVLQSPIGIATFVSTGIGADMHLRTFIYLVASTIVACTISYYWIDKDVAFFVHENEIDQYRFLKWLTFIPDVFTVSAPIVLALGALQMSQRPLPRYQKQLFAASLSLIVTAAYLAALKVVFGRYWPETWINNNPSLIRDGAYGFHLFHAGEAYSSFPSGHTARTFAVTSVFWLACPRWRWLFAFISIAVVIGLVGMNYHFVGDTIAGAVLGSFVGAFTSRLCLTDFEKREAGRVADDSHP